MVLFAHVTSFVAGERHGNLLVEKGGRAFPSVMILDENGKVLTRQPREEYTVEAFRRTHHTATTWRELKAKAEAGDSEVADELFLAELRLGRLDFETARRQNLRFEDFTDEETAEILSLLSNLEMDWALASLGLEDPRRTDKRFVEMKDAGRIPTGPSARIFWLRLLEYARTETDADLFEDALGGMRKLLGDNERYASWFKDMEETLKELRG